ncbi:MAG: translation initiation factor IF-6 [Candidatus Nanohalobium sp.]
MEIQRYDYLGNNNIGFYATVTNGQAIYPPEFKEDRKKMFDIKSCETFINRTRLVGLFTAGNSNCILIPPGATDREKDKLEESGIDFQVIRTKDNALGNLILANDKGAVISEKIEDKKKEIEEALEVPVTVARIAGIKNVGVCGEANSSGVLLHREADEEDAEKVKEALDVENVDIGTVEMGSPYIGSGLIATDEAVLTGESTTGPEIGRIDRTLMQD